MAYNALAGLDPAQTLAAGCGRNAIVAAGAGSGKTRVLAARYVWLVTEKGLMPEEILTLTFTKKAVTEMYARIYAELRKAAAENDNARRAVENFHTARISTLDSYCASIVKNAARLAGLSPDFTVDPLASREQIAAAALPFMLENRTNPAIRLLLGWRKPEDVVENLFVKTFTDYSTLGSPVDFAALLQAQRREILERWRALCSGALEPFLGAYREFAAITDKKVQEKKAYLALKDVFDNFTAPDVPDRTELDYFFTASEGGQKEGIRTALADICSVLQRFNAIAFRGTISDPSLAAIKSAQQLSRDGFQLFAAALNYVLYSAEFDALFPLLDEFRRRVDEQKRQSGKLSYADVSSLALNALKTFPHIRQEEKKSVRAVMTDEFQDNNETQRNLLFLIAEREDCFSKGIPAAAALCPDKLFFVGDEKQSIYKFRGADVSVFRRLKTDLGEAAAAYFLGINYRSHPALIDAFNTLFGGSPADKVSEAAGDGSVSAESAPAVFLAGKVADFEASYAPVVSFAARENGGCGDGDLLPLAGRIHVYLHNTAAAESGAADGEAPESEADDDIAAEEKEAAFTARKIRALVESGYEVFENQKGKAVSRPADYGDFAVLFRSYAGQQIFEKHLRASGVPYVSENIAGFFNDAPVNDLYNMLRLLVYPRDLNAYASVLRSPFASFSRPAMLGCLAVLSGEAEDRRELFSAAQQAILEGKEAAAFAGCRELYGKLRRLENSCSTAELVSFLWYECGYRYETLWNAQVQLYAELYDYFFELAVRADAEGLPLAGFVDRIAQLKRSGERIEDTDIPAERAGGVRLMSIHKSKGLEFPVVFLCAAAGRGRYLQNSDVCYFDTHNGFSLNTPPHPLLGAVKKQKPGNYFFNRQKELEEQKELAELRRLLYVAMTRAESALFITGAYRLKADKLPPDAPMADVVGCLAKNVKTPRSFLDLLLPVLAAGEGQGFFTVEPLEVAPVEPEVSAAREQAAQQAQPLFASAPLITVRAPEVSAVSPSSLQLPPASKGLEAAGLATDAAELFPETALVDRLVETSGGDFSYADFGTIAHACLEALFTGENARVPPSIRSVVSEADFSALVSLAEKMARFFYCSPLGTLAQEALWLKSEFAFKSRVSAPSLRRGFALINGKMDLIFESAGEVYVVDFKTDQLADSRHTAQLACYARAAREIFGKPVRSFLYYLRSGGAAEFTAETDGLLLEPLVAAALQESEAAETA